jgi:hypothetical protein
VRFCRKPLATLWSAFLFTTILRAGTDPATITLEVAPSAISYLQPFTVQVTVTGTLGPGTGQVAPVIDGGTYPNAVLDVNGMAAFSSRDLGMMYLLPGYHHIGVQYSGDSHYLPQGYTSNQVPLAIGPPMDLTASATSVLLGQTVQYTATFIWVTLVTGTVTFFDNGKPIGPPVTVSGVMGPYHAQTSGASTSSVLTSSGTHTITATYSGYPGYFGPVDAGPVFVNVTPSNVTTMTLTSSVNPSALGQSVMFTATLKYDPGEGTPGGAVQFYDGSALLSAVQVSNGQAVLNTSSLGVGSHAIVVKYPGDGVFLSTSASMGQIVNPLASKVTPVFTMTLTSSVNPSGLGQSVVFTATLKYDPDAGTPMGSVQFYDGSTLLSTVQIANRQAALNAASLSAGSHAIVTRYLGDGVFPPTLASLGQVVNPLASTISVSTSPSAPVFGQTITATTQVGPTAPPQGYAAPTGTVTFERNFRPVGTVPLARGSAGWGFSGAGVGPITITAIYNGDGTWGTSHATITLTVGPAAPLQMTNAAANYSASFAPDETVSGFNVNGLSGDASGAVPLGTALGGVTVTVTDSAGTARQRNCTGCSLRRGR